MGSPKMYFILSSSSSDSISVFYDSSNSESSSDDNLTQILQRYEFQQYDSTTSENLNYDDPPISDEVIEAVPLQIILPTEPAQLTILAYLCLSLLTKGSQLHQQRNSQFRGHLCLELSPSFDMHLLLAVKLIVGVKNIPFV
ncbi:hypothetical protein CTI12_AA446910 [Artemisia annua]|uniref:Uncharacterized protein n=1 Tax=Artemisia annua TaxID=35608 RepID=A0A2U1LW85_ARTAN|nr:hypothetical protein CTI12_AA446910 [Artemisia annua]